MISKEKLISVCILFVLLVIGSFLINSNNDLMEEQIDKHSKEVIESQALALKKSIQESISSAKILGKYIEILNGKTDNFEIFSNELITSLYGITNLQLAPNGIVSKIYPLKGNEKAIGHNLFTSDNRNKEALLAKNTKQLTLAGPFVLGQGGVGIIGRQPVFIKDEFWGFTSTLVLIDQLLDTTGFNKLKDNNYLYRLKRIHPDTNKIDVFAGFREFPNEKVFSKKITLANTQWDLDITYIGAYIPNFIMYIIYFIVIVISILLSYLFYIILNKQNESQQQRVELERKVLEQTTEIKENLETIKKRVIYIKTDLDGIITDVSDAFCDMSGYKRDELIGNLHNIIKYADNSESFFKNMWHVLKSNKPWTGEIKNIRKDGSFYWVSAEINPDYNKHGEKIGYISIRQDITAQKELEKEQSYIIEQDKMASLGQMIGNIAHQWRQPLNVISVSASGIKLQNEMNILEKVNLDKLTSEIIFHTKSLSNTIETFRNYSNVENNDEKVVEIYDTLNMIRGTLEDSSIKLKDKITYKNQINKIMISGSLSHVIISIINNSKEILLQKKIINPWIEITAEIMDNSYIISIEDNGGGIEEDILPHIFEPYFTTKHKFQGIGLGLFLSYKIVTENLLGEFHVENTENGAKSFLKIPV